MQITSPAFDPNGAIPRQYSQFDRDDSPPLQFLDVPAGTASLALIMEDLDAPLLGIITHWLVWNLPPELSAGGLAEGQPLGESLTGIAGARQGRNMRRQLGYMGPRPINRSAHRYRFTLYALDQTLALPGGAGKRALLAAMQGHVLAQAELIGTYQR